MILAALAVLACPLVIACGAVRVAERPQIPFTGTEMTAARVVPRAHWLEVTLLSPTFNRVFYFPASDECKLLIAEGSTLAYRRTGGYGYVEQGGVRCDVSGIGSLRQWRDAFGRPTRGMAPAKPRSRADFREVYRDDDVIMVRGTFLLASYLKWPGPDDTIAVFKNDDICNRALERNMGQVEYNPNGPHPLVIIRQGGGCPLEALIRPQ